MIGRRRTRALRDVASVMNAGPHGKYWGYNLSRASGVRPGVLYPMLARMMNDGWLTDGWEDPTTITDGRPPRRYYQLTDTGREALDQIVKETR